MIAINTSNDILFNNVRSGLKVKQTRTGTQVYRPGEPLTIKMPHARYCLTHNAPRPVHASTQFPAPAGRAQFDADIFTIINRSES